MDWRVYYGDGTTFSDEDGPPEIAPKSGVQAVVVCDTAVNYSVLTGADFYCYDPAWDVPQWRHMDAWGFAEYMRAPGWRLVLFGQWIGNHEYQALMTALRKELGDRQRYPHER